MTNCRKIVVIGFGSLNGDDLAGWLCLDKLEQFGELVKLVETGQLILFKSKADGVDWYPVVNGSLKELIEVIFVDAVKSNNDIGVIHMLNDCDRSNWNNKKLSSSSHAINIFESIDLAKSLGYLNVPFTFYGIEIGDESAGEISKEIKNATFVAAENIKSRLLQIIY